MVLLLFYLFLRNEQIVGVGLVYNVYSRFDQLITNPLNFVTFESSVVVAVFAFSF